MKKGIWGLILVTFLILAVFAITFSSCSSSNSLSTYSLSISSNPSEGGQITPASGNFEKQAQVEVTAVPASGYRFDHWEGSVYRTTPLINVLMDGNKDLTAFFTKLYTVTVSSSPADGGSVSLGNGTYDSGKEITLTATPASNYKFDGWKGDASGSSDSLTITVDSNKQIIASFVKNVFNLQTQVEPLGGGIVNPGNGNFEVRTKTMVTATPSNGYRFDHWGGSAAAMSNPLEVYMDSNKAITACFTKVYKINVSSSPEGIGNVIPDKRIFDAGTTATLTASTSVFPYGFDHWRGTDNDNINPTTVTMDSDKIISAYFKQYNPINTQTINSYIVLQDGRPARVAGFQLKAGQWVQGQLTGQLYELSSRIVDSSNKVVMDLGKSSFKTFQFQAPVDDWYSFVITDIHSVDYNYLMLEYTIYS